MFSAPIVNGEIAPAATACEDGTHNPAGHGTYVRYNIGRCRCEECRKANTEYETRRCRLKAYGRFPWVEPQRSREHLKELVEAGCGVRTISRISGVSRTTLKALLTGKPDASSHGGRRPLRRVHAGTESRLLAVEPEDVRTPEAVNATDVWTQIEEMVDFGISRARIARAMGKKKPALQLSRDRVSPKSAKEVSDVHWGLWLHSPGFRAVCRCPLPASVQRRLEDSG